MDEQPKSTIQDEHFAEQALKLARQAAMALEEAYSYCEEIESGYLRDKIEQEIDKIVEFL